MKLIDLYQQIDQNIAPFHLAESWDNCGLLLGDFDQEIHRVLICLDVTEGVVRQAQQLQTDVILSHHPVIFTPMQAVSYHSVIAQLIRNGIAVISAHTNLDITTGGVNDILCKHLQITDLQPLQRIDETASLGRIGVLPDCCETAENLAKFTAKQLQSAAVSYLPGTRPLCRVAVCSGAGGSVCEDVIQSDVGAFITGELKHNQLLDLQQAGVAVVLAGHLETERVIVPELRRQLQDLLPNIIFYTADEPSILQGV